MNKENCALKLVDEIILTVLLLYVVILFQFMECQQLLAYSVLGLGVGFLFCKATHQRNLGITQCIFINTSFP